MLTEKNKSTNDERDRQSRKTLGENYGRLYLTK